jgi:hypothetical protein
LLFFSTWMLFSYFDVHVIVHRGKSRIIKPTRCTNFSSLFLDWNSTCFGQSLCPLILDWNSTCFGQFLCPLFLDWNSTCFGQFLCPLFLDWNSTCFGQFLCPLFLNWNYLFRTVPLSFIFGLKLLVSDSSSVLYFWIETLLVSDSSSVHHHESLYLVDCASFTISLYFVSNLIHL